MNIRKDRQHQCGLTNLDFRSKGDITSLDRYNPTLKNADFGTMGYSQYKRKSIGFDFNEQSKRSGGWKSFNSNNLNPKTDTTKELYEMKGKREKYTVRIGLSKENQLEASQFTDKVFTGDNPQYTASLAEEARGRNYFNTDSKRNANQTQRAKDETNANADQDTKLISIKNTDTKEGQVDLTKIRDIRRALRRRYATRKNFQKIFTQWDADGKGYLDSNDIHGMVNKMGLRINKDEASVLLLSSDYDQNNQLSMNEFMDLIFSQNDALNVDTSKIRRDNEDYETFPKGGIVDPSQVFSGIMKNAEDLQSNRFINQWKFFIQKNLNNISLDLLTMDEQKTYQVQPHQFAKVIESRVKLPEYLKQNPEHLYKLISDYTDAENGNINYIAMIENIRDFNFYSPGKEEKVTDRLSSGHSDFLGQIAKKTTTIFQDDYIIQDSQRVPPHTLDQIQVRFQKVSNHMKRIFASQNELQNAISSNLTIDKNGNVSVEQIKRFVLEVCQDDIAMKKLSKNDIEGYLSAFKYNTYGATNANDISSIMYSDSCLLDKKLDNRVRGNPPPAEVNKDIEKFMIKDGDQIHNMKVKEVLKNLEEKVFIGPTKMYQIFRQFDKDGDGYVSYADFEDQLSALKVPASKQEIAGIMKIFDKEQKGYLDYKSFADNVNPHMSEQVNVQQREIHLPNLVPNRAKATEYQNRSFNLRNAAVELRKSLQQDPDQKLLPNGRFSSRPQKDNTFMTFQSSPKSPGYVSEKDRFSGSKRDMNSSVELQKQDKERQLSLVKARADVRKFRLDNIAQRINENETQKVAFQQNKIYKMGANQDLYEKISHMSSL